MKSFIVSVLFVVLFQYSYSQENNYNYTVDTIKYYLSELIILNKSFLHDLDSFIFKTDYCNRNDDDIYIMNITQKKDYIYEIQVFSTSSKYQRDYMKDAKGFFIMNNFKFFVNGILPENPRPLFSIKSEKMQFNYLEKTYPNKEDQNYFTIDIFDPCITVLDYRYGRLYYW